MEGVSQRSSLVATAVSPERERWAAPPSAAVNGAGIGRRQSHVITAAVPKELPSMNADRPDGFCLVCAVTFLCGKPSSVTLHNPPG